ncbi:MAG: DUF2911 domain-containing protein [Gemmatimonadetes bacterium]|nr:DUF2911 domain-containing protein [Gemmatimonadota bacterium]
MLLALMAAAAPVAAQMPVITTPRESPSATVSQVVGMTRVTVEYARPSVNGRKIWGGLVPYDAVWRAGANENTVLSISSPFTVGGMKLPAGRYGLHTIPTAGAWTVMVSRQADAWGSFSYNSAEDAVRFSVTPAAAEHEEMLRSTSSRSRGTRRPCRPSSGGSGGSRPHGRTAPSRATAASRASASRRWRSRSRATPPRRPACATRRWPWPRKRR